jgi:hypothetical protein
MGRTDLRKIENKTGTKDVDKKAPYLFSLDVKLRKPEEAQADKQVADGTAAPADATQPAATTPAAAGTPAPTTAAPPAAAPAPDAAKPAPAATPQPASAATEKGEKK